MAVSSMAGSTTPFLLRSIQFPHSRDNIQSALCSSGFSKHRPLESCALTSRFRALRKSVLRRAKRVGVSCEASSSTVSAAPAVDWVQRFIELPEFKRGCHNITKRIYSAIPEIKQYEVGLAHLFLLHTSASLTINENASPDVPLDMEDTLNRIIPEGHHYRHLDEGLDDMPAHVKSSLLGCSITIPITAGRLSLGIWQGIWLNEHRNYGGPRRLCITMHGQKRSDQRLYH